MHQQSQSATGEDVVALQRVYRLLSRLWLHGGDEELISELRAPSMFEAFAGAGGVLPAELNVRTQDELAAEYCRLFVGPSGHLPLYQSVWQAGRYQGPAVGSMERVIEIARYRCSEQTDGVMVDHLGVQLEVADHLLGLMSMSKDETDLLMATRELFSTFFGAHLLWPLGMLEIAAHRTTSRFYRAIIQMTRNFLLSESRCWQVFEQTTGFATDGRSDSLDESTAPLVQIQD